MIYQPGEINLSYCCRRYLRWQTTRNLPLTMLQRLDDEALQEIVDRFSIRILELYASNREWATLLSLEPNQSTATCVSKIKGQVSKWLRQHPSTPSSKLLATGYFACSCGQTATDTVAKYLDAQADHHGFVGRSRRTYSAKWEVTRSDRAIVESKHAKTDLRYHIVLATPYRSDVFDAQSAKPLAEQWRRVCFDNSALLTQASFLPDHVHLAVRVHPQVVPKALLVLLMNEGQQFMERRFITSMVQQRLDRLWQPSAFIGSFGDWVSPKISKYIRNLSRDRHG